MWMAKTRKSPRFIGPGVAEGVGLANEYCQKILAISREGEKAVLARFSKKA